MIKGEIWRAVLPSPRGSEPGKKRPVLVIQGDSFNRSALNTVICAVITSNIRLADAPGNLLLETADSKLPKTSVINFSQIITVDKSFFTGMVCMLPKPLLQKVDISIKQIFDI